MQLGIQLLDICTQSLRWSRDVLIRRKVLGLTDDALEFDSQPAHHIRIDFGHLAFLFSLHQPQQHAKSSNNSYVIGIPPTLLLVGSSLHALWLQVALLAVGILNNPMVPHQAGLSANFQPSRSVRKQLRCGWVGY